MYKPNRVYWESGRPDLSRVPPEIKQQLKPRSMEENEVRARITIFKNPHFKGMQHPTGRLYVAPYQSDEEKPDVYDGITINLEDFTGHVPLACAVLTFAQIENVIKNLMREYKRSNGNIEKICEILEDIKNERIDDSESGFDVQPYGSPGE